MVDITLAWLDPFFSSVVDLLIGYFLLKMILVDITLAWLDPNCSKIPTSPSPLLSQFHPTKALDPTSSQQRGIKAIYSSDSYSKLNRGRQQPNNETEKENLGSAITNVCSDIF